MIPDSLEINSKNLSNQQGNSLTSFTSNIEEQQDIMKMANELNSILSNDKVKITSREQLFE